MNDELIADLKQFIVVTVSQATADLPTKDDLAREITEVRGEVAGVREELGELRTEMNHRFDELDVKVATIADAHAEILDDHDRRLTRLEHKTAA